MFRFVFTGFIILVAGPLLAQTPNTSAVSTGAASASAASTGGPESFTTNTAPVLVTTPRDTTGLTGLLTNKLPDLGLKLKQIKQNKKKSRKPKQSTTEYAGLPMERVSIRTGSDDRIIEEQFYVLKTPQEPSVYVREIFWYDADGRRVTSSVIQDRSKARLLHGPYRRYQNGNLIEEGFYYVGAKDGRWEKYDAKFMLLDKTRWQRGFPAESRITYYDSAHTRIKEVIPVEYGQVKGTYLAFYENGRLAAEGKYDYGVKVGRWTEYYPTGQRRMRRKVTQYGRDRWEADVEPYVVSEWDERGKQTYAHAKDKTTAPDPDDQP